ncbi:MULTISPECIES: glycosyltransferase family 2 protein [Methylotenera]|uniref:glycosyltransferase family 2 protein n=1 Tax=Methylotenera TaxID=359407 RepID=UPI00035ED447|nr:MULTISPECIES: glycosyltransferase family 2 protein [Methylotenera]
MVISVILISYNTAEMSVEALNALFASQGEFTLEVFVVDNASKDDSVARIKKAFPQVTLIENIVNVGFGRANNQVLDLATGEYILLLNTDAFVQPDTIAKTIQYAESQPRCGVLGVRLVGRDGEQQPSCRYFPTPFNLFAFRLGLTRWFSKLQMVDDVDWNPSITESCDWVPGCYYLIRKEVINQVGLFDPIYFLYSEEVDHCFAVKKAGWDVIYFADASVVHIGGESAKSDGKVTTSGKQLSVLQAESELLYFRKNHGFLSAVLNIMLVLLADFIQLIKDLIRLKLHKNSPFFVGSKLTLISAFKTRIGSIPVR